MTGKRFGLGRDCAMMTSWFPWCGTFSEKGIGLSCLVRTGLALWVVLFSLIAGAVSASPPRLALVLGNSEYEFGRLKNPANDAVLIAASLRDVGFQVFEHIEADQREMKRAIVNFGRALGEAGEDAVGLVYYAGHGVQVGGENYMIPVGAKIEDELDVDIEGIRASTLLTALDRAGNRLNIVILDACRNNPFRASSRSAATGLARMDAPSGTLLAYSTSPGNIAEDGAGRNSPYTQALARAIREPSAKVEDVFKRVRIAVMERTNEKQVPWEASSLTGDFYFIEPQPGNTVPPTVIQPAPVAQPSSQMAEIEYWKAIANSDNPDMFRGYMAQFPEGIFASIATDRIASLEQDNAARSTSRDRDIEQTLWDEVKDSGDPALLQSFLAQYPDSIYKGLAETRLSSLQAKSAAELKPAAPAPMVVAAASPALAGGLNWVGTATTRGRHTAGVSWCASGKELKMELAEENGSVSGFVLDENGRSYSVRGKIVGGRLDAKLIFGSGFRVIGSRSGDEVSGKIWSPVNSTVCGATFTLSLTRN